MTALPKQAATAAKSGENYIRPFTANDAGEVAAILLRAFQKSDRAAAPGFVDYLRSVYLDTPWYDPEVAARVMVRPDGRIAGFVGVTPLPMLLDGKPFRAAMTSSISVDDRLADPMTGPRLMRDVRDGPADAVLSDRCNEMAIILARQLRSEVAGNYSLDWLRVLRPAAFAAEMLGRRFAPARLVKPLLGPLDRRLQERALASVEPHWPAPGLVRGKHTFADEAVSIEQLTELVPALIAHHPLRPELNRAQWRRILTDGSQKANFGDFVARVVTGRDGEQIGLFMYHCRPGQVAEVLQILALPGHEGHVLDRALTHAAEMGAVAMHGRVQPALMEPLRSRRAFFLAEQSTIINSRNQAMLDHFHKGTAFFTGLAGEHWMRLNGDQL